jgi:endonuclease/exonuclease/phosphatase family metal-dependent hydrolase
LAIKLFSLNIEADRHLDRVRAAIAEHAPDIVCLQEVFEADCARLASIAEYRVKFALSSRMPRSLGAPADWGIAVLSRVPVRHEEIVCYSEDPRVRIFAAPNDPRRILVTTELDHLGGRYRICTTHFTWSEEGQISGEQIADFHRLEHKLTDYQDYVLCGDFNAPRGREMFAHFTDRLSLIDHLPAHVSSTIDGRFHRAGDLNLAVDTVFATEHYRVSEVQVIDGLSDHKAIIARIESRPRTAECTSKA